MQTPETLEDVAEGRTWCGVVLSTRSGCPLLKMEGGMALYLPRREREGRGMRKKKVTLGSVDKEGRLEVSLIQYDFSSFNCNSTYLTQRYMLMA